MGEEKFVFLYVTLLLFCGLLIVAVSMCMNRGIVRYKEMITFKIMSHAALVSVASEIIWEVMKPGAKEAVWIAWASNLLDLLATSTMTYFWYCFIEGILDGDDKERRGYLRPSMIPLIFNVIMHLSAYWTHATFYIDESKQYVRGSFYWLHALITLSYLFVSLGIIIYHLVKGSSMDRRKILPLLVFTICPIVGGLLQVLVGVAPFSVMSFVLAITYLFVALRKIVSPQTP